MSSSLVLSGNSATSWHRAGGLGYRPLVLRGTAGTGSAAARVAAADWVSIGHPLEVVGEGPEGPCRLAKLPQRLAQVVAQAYREVGITTIRVEPAGASPGVLLDAG